MFFLKIFVNNPCFLWGNLTQLHTAQWFHWHRCVMHSGGNDNPVQIWHRCDFGPHIPEALATFKGNIYRKNILRKIFLHYIYSIAFTQQIWGLTRDGFGHCDQSRQFRRRFSSRIRIHIQKGFNLCISAWGRCLMKKNQRSKISCQVPFKGTVWLAKKFICSWFVPYGLI
jgi:hypothetical protein